MDILYLKSGICFPEKERFKNVMAIKFKANPFYILQVTIIYSSPPGPSFFLDTAPFFKVVAHPFYVNVLRRN